MVDVVVIGAGPVGLACGIACNRQGLSSRLIEKGTLVNSIVGYPTNMEFFSTPELLEIGDHPFPTHRYKPQREEAIDYYRRVASVEQLDVRLYERVTQLTGSAGAFTVTTDKDEHTARAVVVATGFFDVPNRLDVPGEELAKVSHYFKEPYPYTGRNVAVIGAKNSAAKAALSCRRHGANVTMVIRGPEVSSSVKYWIRPDLVNRIEEGSIKAYFDSTVEMIDKDTITVNTPDGIKVLANDAVLALTGYRPDYEFLGLLSIGLNDDVVMTPVYDEATFESNRAGVYLAGTICGGLHTSRWFIENGRFHAAEIARHVASTRTRA